MSHYDGVVLQKLHDGGCQKHWDSIVGVLQGQIWQSKFDTAFNFILIKEGRSFDFLILLYNKNNVM